MRDATVREERLHRTIRGELFPRLRTPVWPPPSAGHHADVTRDELEAIHHGLLFNGGVEACDGAFHMHDTLALTLYQIGVTLVSHQGNGGTWSQRLFRRDLRQECSDPVDEVIAILERRNEKAARSEEMSTLIQKTLLGYAERAILLDRSTAVWRMGHGNPVPYELLVGGGSVELMEASLNALRRLIAGHKKFLFVAREPRERDLLTVGHALAPWEFAVVKTLEQSLEHWLHQRRFSLGAERSPLWDGKPLPAPDWIPKFIREIASQVVVGVFRATPLGRPAQSGASDHVQVAALIAIADAMFQEETGVPLSSRKWPGRSAEPSSATVSTVSRSRRMRLLGCHSVAGRIAIRREWDAHAERRIDERTPGRPDRNQGPAASRDRRGRRPSTGRTRMRRPDRSHDVRCRRQRRHERDGSVAARASRQGTLAIAGSHPQP